MLTRVSDDALDRAYRNPTWAYINGSGVRPPSGFLPGECVDGTEQRHRFQGVASVMRSDDVALDVWLIPQAGYHFRELGPLLLELRERGFKAGFVFVDSPPPALASLVAQYGGDAWRADALSHAPKVVVCQNDWGAIRALLDACRLRGARVVAKVEGPQDFNNLETKSPWRPYSYADLVLAQGMFDEQRLGHANAVSVVGSSRLERVLARDPAAHAEPVCHGPLINLSFSYGVLSDWSRPWYELAMNGIRRAGLVGLTSVHPAMNLGWVRNKTDWPLSLELEISSHLITRRSSALLDCVAMGAPAIFFNPHRERVWRELDWPAEVPQVLSARGLAEALHELSPLDGEAQKTRRAWLRDQFVSVDQSSSEERGADAVCMLF